MTCKAIEVPLIEEPSREFIMTDEASGVSLKIFKDTEGGIVLADNVFGYWEELLLDGGEADFIIEALTSLRKPHV